MTWDAKFIAAFDAAFTAVGIEVVKTTGALAHRRTDDDDERLEARRPRAVDN
jgi:hypothetical protein